MTSQDTTEAAGCGYDCPICAEPVHPGDNCATDIELGTCHAECLAGSPVVNLDTGEPIDGPVSTFLYEGATDAAGGELDAALTAAGAIDAALARPAGGLTMAKIKIVQPTALKLKEQGDEPGASAEEG